MKYLLFATLFILSQSVLAQKWLVPSSRAYTSRDQGIENELFKRKELISSGAPMTFSWSWCNSTDSSVNSYLCKAPVDLGYQDSKSSFDVSPLIEYNFRRDEKLNNYTHHNAYGGILRGHLESLSFWVDARVNAETHSNQHSSTRTDLSWDREFIDVQDEDAVNSSNGATYVSYARYRANLNIETSLGDVGFKRETIHWGPGTYLNLVFNYQAVPFNHLYYEAEIGPFRVWTVWGRLLRSQNGQYQVGTDTKSVYAHRYEWSVFPDLTLGVTEQMVLFNTEEPAAFVPIVPLFMEKGQGVEKSNNGNIAFDLAYRVPKWALLYSEFLIDDLQDPSTLFDDFWGNRWAWMAGLNFAPKTFHGMSLLVEYSRVEPWVYTHYEPLTSQASNGEDPLGNQLGPNSQVWIVQPSYSTPNYFFGLKSSWIRKGINAGSSIKDGSLEREKAESLGLIENNKKVFLRGAKLEFSIGPVIRWRGYGFQVDLEADYFGLNDQVLFRLGYQY